MNRSKISYSNREVVITSVARDLLFTRQKPIPSALKISNTFPARRHLVEYVLLWETAGYADWLERKQPGSIDFRVCDSLLDLCDGLPEGGKYAVEGKFLRAKRLARSGDAKREQDVLGGIVSIPRLPETYLAPACKMLGASLEASGDYRGALETYELLESDAERFSSAADCLMSAVLIDLRLGNNDEAVRLIRILQGAPAAVIQGATSAARIREFVDLVKTGRVPNLRPAPEHSPLVAGFSPSPPPDDPMDRWIRNAGLPWFDYADPENLEDPRIKDLEAVLERPDAVFKPAEQIKLLLLAARDPRRSAERRRQSFREAVRRLLEDAPDYRTLDAIASAVVNDAGLDEDTRVQTLKTALAILAEAGRRGDYWTWRRHPVAAAFGPDFQGKLSLLDKEADVDRGSAAAILALADSIAAKPMSPFAVLTMRDLLGFLLRLGDVRSAGSLASAMPSWNLEPEAAGGADAEQAEFLRLVRSAASVNPVHEALAAGLRSLYPAAPDGLPGDYADLRLDLGVPARAPEVTFQACRHLVEVRAFYRGDLRFWGTVLRSLPIGSERAAAAGDLLRESLRAAPDDELRSELIVLFFTSVDIDDPGVRSAIESAWAPYRQPAGCPNCYFVIRLYEIHRDLRLGLPVALEAAFSDLGDPRVEIVRQRTCLRSYTQAGDRGALRRTVDGMDAGRLLSPAFLTVSIPAYELLGDGQELAMATGAARRALREAVLDSWIRHDEEAGSTALDLALAVGDEAALPPGWILEMGSGPGSPLFQGRVRLVQAFLASDWTRVEGEAASINRDYPSNYSFFWYRGLALHHLGRDGEAAAALRIYTQHARDEPEYPRAVALLASLGAGK